MTRGRTISALSIVAMALTVACGEEPVTPDPVTWKIEALNPQQEGTVGTQVDPLLFHVFSSDGTSGSGVVVQYTTVEGSASIEVLSGGARGSGEGVTLQDATDASGQGGVQMRLGVAAGVYHVRAVISLRGDSIADAFVYGIPGAPESVVLSGTAQVATAGAQLPVPLGVIVSDRYGNAIPEVPITWTIFSGGGTLGSDMVLTNEAGGAYVQWTLGSVAGTQEVTATVTDLGDFLFTATAR